MVVFFGPIVSSAQCRVILDKGGAQICTTIEDSYLLGVGGGVALEGEGVRTRVAACLAPEYVR